MKVVIFFSCLIIITMFGCDNQPDVTDLQIEHPSVNGLIPMKEGNYWIYLSSSYDSTGRQYPGNLDTTKILKDTLINNEPWFIFSDGDIKTNRDNGLWFFRFDAPRLYFPLTPNDSVCIAMFSANSCDYYIKLTKINQPVNIFGNKYFANVYDTIFPDQNNAIGFRNYFVPNLGVVRSEFYGAPNEYNYNGLYLTRDLVFSYIQ